MTSPLNNLTDTWNNSGTTFYGLKYNITNTASAASSKFLDIQSGGASVLAVAKTTSAGGTGLIISAESPNGQTVSITPRDGSTGVVSFTNGAAYGFDGHIFSGTFFGLGASYASADVFLNRDAANIFAQRNSTSAQTFRVYNTYTDASNYERGVFDWTTTSNVLTIGTQALGTGTARGLLLTALGGNSKIRMGGTNLANGDVLTSDRVLVDANNNRFVNPANFSFAFTSSNAPIDNSTTVDTGISRSAAGVIAIGNGTSGDGSATILAKTKAGAFAAGDIPSGTWALCRDTSGATTKLIYNNAGTLMTVALT